MFQRRSHRTAPRSRSFALGGALAALAVVGGGTVVAVSAPTEVTTGDILLAQNAAGETATAQELALGVPVDLDLEPVVARAAGGTIPAGTAIQVTGLPDGLTQRGWVISGTPTRAGDYDVLVTVSNGAVSQSQKLTVTVTDDTVPATATATPTTTTTTQPAPGQPAPTLSAVPGSPAADPVEGAEADGSAPVTTDEDDEAGTSPDLCAVLGEGGTDGASLTSLLPALTGGDDSASSGLVSVLVNAIVGLLPSVLGDGGSVQDLGSAGQLLCTLSPSLLGGASAGEVDGQATGATPAETAPAALLGLLTSGAGSLGA